MREAFVGFDSAWAGKAPGGIAWASFVDHRLESCAEPQLAGFDDAARRIETLRTEHDYVLVAIDQPTVVPNQTGQRPVDGVARSLIAQLRSGVQPANRSKATMFGPNAPIWRFLERLRASQDPAAARTAASGLYLLEVFPALALPALQPEIMARGKAAFYNPARKKTFTLADWRLVADAVRERAGERGLPLLSGWLGRQTDLAAPDKQDQDRLDAAICLLVALEWRQAPRDRVAVIGDAKSGYMVTPVSPATRKILKRAAREQQVPFDSSRAETRTLPQPTLHLEDDQHDRRSAGPAPSESSRSDRRSRIRVSFDEAALRARLVQAARAHTTVEYGDVARAFGFRWSQGTLSALTATLRLLGEANRRRGEPQLMALVVNKAEGLPGQGYFRTIGADISSASDQRELHREELEKVWKFDWPD